MLPAERRNHILNILQKEGKVEVDTIAAELDVSPMTIRRDLILLEEQGLAFRTHGGAVSHNGLLKEVPYTSKEISNIDEKQRIGREAAALIKEGQYIFLDSGTTTLEIARAIKNMRELTVITNDLKIALELSEGTEIKVFCTGGLVQNRLGTLLGTAAESFLAGIKVDITFLATSSLDINWGITSPSMEKALLKKKMMICADQVILVTDHSKFGKKAFAQIAPIQDVNLLITGRELSDTYKEQLKKLEVRTRLI